MRVHSGNTGDLIFDSERRIWNEKFHPAEAEIPPSRGSIIYKIINQDTAVLGLPHVRLAWV